MKDSDFDKQIKGVEQKSLKKQNKFLYINLNKIYFL